MSMLIYLVPGTGTSLTPRGFSHATCVKPIPVGDNTVSCPMSAGGEATVTKNGVSRILIKSGLELPRAALQSCGCGVLSMANATGVELNSFHTVGTLGPLLTQMLRGDPMTADQARAIIRILISAQVAMICGDFSLGNANLPENNPFVRGALGQEPLDVTTGHYGKVTV